MADDKLKVIQDSIVSSKQDLLKVTNLASNFIRDVQDVSEGFVFSNNVQLSLFFKQCKDPFLDYQRAVSDIQNSLNQLQVTMTKIEELEEVRQSRVDSQKWNENLWSKLCQKITEVSERLSMISRDCQNCSTFSARGVPGLDHFCCLSDSR